MNNMANNDKNFLIKSSIERNDVTFYSSLSDCFSLHGLIYENGHFRRMPESIASEVSSGVYYSHTLTTGGRLRFLTNSSFVAIRVTYGSIERSSHVSLNGMAGFDLYENQNGVKKHLGSFIPPLDTETHFESIITLANIGEHELTINFPTYSEVKELHIGLSEDAYVKPAPSYTYDKPIVFYGSSITHGACSSRPGNTYPEMISRILDTDYINLGFGGNALGEKVMGDYIASLSMSVFVMDYDYNAPDEKHLMETHSRMYRIVRETNPTLPIIMMSKPKPHLNEVDSKRLDIIKSTYNAALEHGDENIYFVPGYELIPDTIIDSAKVDTVHPNDLGYYSMAKRVMKELDRIYIKNRPPKS